MRHLRDRLLQAAGHTDRAERTLRVAAVLCDALARAGAAPVLVGGGAVEVYTRSAYTTHDLDFVAAASPDVDETMAGLGFTREGRHWMHERLGIVVEFPGTTLGPARAASIDVEGMRLRIIAVEDLIVDRLASWKHWGWDADGAAAVLLLAIHENLDRRRLRERARQEDVLDALEMLRSRAAQDATLTHEELRELRIDLERGDTDLER